MWSSQIPNSVHGGDGVGEGLKSDQQNLMTEGRNDEGVVGI